MPEKEGDFSLWKKRGPGDSIIFSKKTGEFPRKREFSNFKISKRFFFSPPNFVPGITGEKRKRFSFAPGKNFPGLKAGFFLGGRLKRQGDFPPQGKEDLGGQEPKKRGAPNGVFFPGSPKICAGGVKKGRISRQCLGGLK